VIEERIDAAHDLALAQPAGERGIGVEQGSHQGQVPTRRGVDELFQCRARGVFCAHPALVGLPGLQSSPRDGRLARPGRGGA